MSIQLDIDSMFGGSMASPNEAHMACVLLLDTSASMEGESIRSLNEAVARF